MSQIIEAIYENGLLRPLTVPQGLSEGQRVVLAVQASAEESRSRESAGQEDDFLQDLEAEGLLDHYPWAHGPAPKDFKPLEAIGKPLSQIILEDRE